MSKNFQQKEKQPWAKEELKIDSARVLRGIYYIDPDDMDRESCETRKLEVRRGFCNAGYFAKNLR